jgi:hypothetical protein
MRVVESVGRKTKRWNSLKISRNVKTSEIDDNREQSDIQRSAMFDPEKVDSGSQLLSRKC